MEQKTIVDRSLREVREHGSGDFPIGIYRDDFSEFEHGQIAWHWHEEIQFDRVLKGKVLVQIGPEEFALNENEGIFINTGMLHRIVPVDEDKKEITKIKPDTYVIDSYVCSWRLAESDRLSRVYRECISPLLEAKMAGAVLSGKETEYLRQMAESYRNGDPSQLMAVKGYLCMIWSELLEKHEGKSRVITPKEERDFERVKRAMSYMQEHFCEKVRLEDIAKMLAISKSELCRCFARILKMSPMEYLIRYRLEEAGKMLLTDTKNITEIAVAVGFDSASHLGRFFLKSFGCTPGEYRNKAGLRSKRVADKSNSK